MKINEFTEALTRKYQPQTLNESFNEEGSRKIDEADLGDRGRYDGPRIVQYSVDVYDSSFSKSGLSEGDIVDALEESGIQVLGCDYQCSWKNDRDYEKNIQESFKGKGSKRINESSPQSDLIRVALELNDILLQNGYNPTAEDIEAYTDYIMTTRDETGENYSVADWFKDTKDNYPEELDALRESLNEDIDAKPNYSMLIDMIESGALDYKFVAEELLRWMPDDELGEFISLYVDPYFEESLDKENSPVGESLNEAKKGNLPIRKALQAADIMKTLDKDPEGTFKRAIEVVKNSPEVSDKDKRDFIKYMSSGSRDKKASTLASYFYDVNLASI